MAKDAKPAEPPPADGSPAKPRKKLPKMAIIIALVTVVEGIGFFTVTKMFGGGPQVAHGEEAHTDHIEGGEPTEVKGTVEVLLMEKFRVPNDKSGRLFIYDFDVYVKVETAHKEAMDKLVAERKGEMADRVARIVRGNETSILHEPDLKTLRMQFRHAIGDLAGDPEIVLEVLIPRFVPIRSD